MNYEWILSMELHYYYGKCCVWAERPWSYKVTCRRASNSGKDYLQQSKQHLRKTFAVPCDSIKRVSCRSQHWDTYTVQTQNKRKWTSKAAESWLWFRWRQSQRLWCIDTHEAARHTMSTALIQEENFLHTTRQALS